jgi:uncharacterized protein YcnI
VVKEGDVYQLGLRFANLGQYTRNRKPEYVKTWELTRELVNETNLDASFVVEENGRGVYFDRRVVRWTGHIFHRLAKDCTSTRSLRGKPFSVDHIDSRVILSDDGESDQTGRGASSKRW